MRACALLAVVLVFGAASGPSPRDLLNAARPLTVNEIAAVLDASRHAVARKTFQVSSLMFQYSGDVLIGPAGRPRFVRSISGIEGGVVGGVVGTPAHVETHWQEEIISIVDHTGRPARRCGGSVEPGELLIVYTRRGSSWTAVSRRRDPSEVQNATFEHAFELLRGAAALTSGERGSIGGRPARAFVAPWTPPPDRGVGAPRLTGDPLPNVAGEPAPPEMTERLWIDLRSLLPLRWEVMKRGARVYGYDLLQMPLDIRPPAGVAAPDCIR